MRRAFTVKAFLAMCCLSALVAAHAAPADQKKAQLAELKSRIESLKEEVARSEATRADAADQLRETERAMSDIGRRLRELAQAQGAIQNDLARLQAQMKQLQGQIDAQQKQLGTLLHRQYLAGESDALGRFIGGQDPNQPARDAHYLRSISRAKLQWLSGLKSALEEKSRLTEEVKAKSAELAGLEEKSRADQAELLEQRKKHKEVLRGIATKIRTQQKEISSMKRDETRLAQLVQGLTRIVRKPAPKPAAPPETAKAGDPPGEKPAEKAPGKGAEKQPEKPAEKAAATELSHFVSPTGISFAQLQGRLPLPVAGAIAHKYGSKRTDGSSTWKGVFIRATGGDVAAVAPGRVVFADWWRGVGNLIILDHGDGYMTLYGYNETLYKGVGDSVAAGEAIAAVGSSGGSAETGLYFELRYQGQTMDPLKWTGRK